MTVAPSVPLDRWELLDFEPGAGSAEVGTGWLSVIAPADTYQALIDAGRLEHPFQGRGEDTAAWVRDREWWWRTRFDAPSPASDEAVELVFEGLDTFASIFLDGRLIGTTDNMFRRYVFDIGAHVTAGQRHTLAIRFDPPARAVDPVDLPVWSAFTDRVSRSRRNLIRKAQFGWGWDWGPDLPTVGVWKSARIEVRPRTRLGDVRFTALDLASSTATAAIHVEIEDHADRPAPLQIHVELADPDGVMVFETRQSSGDAEPVVAIVKNPRLWWTADLGDQPLYSLTVRLLDAERVLDQARHEVGLRTLAIDRSPDPAEPGAEFFRFVLNGVPIFAKGACWVPTTSFVADVEAEPYDRLIDQAVGANMNMIRVWGGGIYEPDRFYDLCDRKGMLVWQDFMFACAHYPEDGAFAASVQAEVEDQVRRLRHHPCLALWCGNNESQGMNRINADMGGDPVVLSGLALYDTLIPEVLGRLDPATPYWPGSPWGGSHPNSMRAGDVHNWTVWHGLPPIPDDTMIGDYAVTAEGIAYTRYAEDHSRFISEFGIQAAPAMATLRRWMDADDLTPESPGFLARIKDEARKAEAMMSTVTGAPTTLQDYVDFTQWTQAEGLKFGIEHFRRRRPQCSGALLWQFNDCWPCVSWSLVDYDGVEKAGYHAVRRAFAPVLASFLPGPDGATELWISNDTLMPVEGQAIVAMQSLDGGEDWRETVGFSAPPGGHGVAWRGAGPQSDDRVLRVWSPDSAFEPNRQFSAPISRLTLVPGARPGVSIVRKSPVELRIDLSAEVYLAFVHLTSERADLRFSDNHFDLAAGERRSVTITAAGPIGPADVAVACWNDRSV